MHAPYRLETTPKSIRHPELVEGSATQVRTPLQTSFRDLRGIHHYLAMMRERRRANFNPVPLRNHNIFRGLILRQAQDDGILERTYAREAQKERGCLSAP